MVSYSTGQPLATWRWLERRCLGGLWHLCSGGGTPREPPLRASTSLLEARSPPRSDRANSHDFRPRAIPRSSRSAALLLRQMRPCVVSRRFVSIAEVHSIRARAHVAQSEPEMARDRFGFLEHHGFVKSSSGSTSKATGLRPDPLRVADPQLERREKLASLSRHDDALRENFPWSVSFFGKWRAAGLKLASSQLALAS
jgi:hypothetical protein